MKRKRKGKRKSDKMVHVGTTHGRMSANHKTQERPMNMKANVDLDEDPNPFDPAAIPLIGARIRWFDGFANKPQLYIEIPEEAMHAFDSSEPIWEATQLAPNRWIVHASYRGITQFTVYTHLDGPKNKGPREHRGYGGATFRHRLTNNEVITCDDCWSGRAELLPFDANDVIVNNTHGWALHRNLHHQIVTEYLGQHIDAEGTITKESDRYAQALKETLTSYLPKPFTLTSGERHLLIAAQKSYQAELDYLTGTSDEIDPKSILGQRKFSSYKMFLCVRIRQIAEDLHIDGAVVDTLRYKMMYSVSPFNLLDGHLPPPAECPKAPYEEPGKVKMVAMRLIWATNILEYDREVNNE